MFSPVDSVRQSQMKRVLKYMFVKCIICNKNFRSHPSYINNGRGKYCSNECRYNGLGKRKEIINCKYCNTEFYGYSKRDKYCSHPCYIKTQIGRQPWNKGKKLPQLSGINNHKWKNNNVGYQGLHGRLRRTFKKPNSCEQCGKINCKLEWALLKGKEYEWKRENFWVLCTGCHRRYDMLGRKAPKTAFKKGHMHSLNWYIAMAKRKIK